ncbi:hypothetical protein DKT68_19530 [Micromonospora acroterricola]|uniref:Uncharacterized protein n=1 Tax=Micromonospora acroterricola TaxID=2202421 RepID=A0A317D3P9_9ACTN|nr:RNA polymerase sigma factor SigJ [Micromonospora acroterricola]PWR07263.1 hypothetical protein DKT68_19530 [Micromonospora acroterricola]
MTSTRPSKVLVLGGGYAGIMSANRLAGSRGAKAEITLVTPLPHFVERIRLHEVAARPGSESATRFSVRSLLHPSVRLRLGTATRIHPAQHQVDILDTTSGTSWVEAYDKLIYAVGSGETSDNLPGVSEHAYTISSIERAHALRYRLDALSAGASVLVVGGGATAIELVTEIAVARPSLRLAIVTSSVIGPTLSPMARAYLRRARAMRTVEIVENTPVAEVTATGVTTRAGEEMAADCVVWAASFGVPSLARHSGLDVDVAGRLTVNAMLRSPAHWDIVGAGDACVITDTNGANLRMACATAAPQGAHAAAVVTAALKGRTPEPFALAYLVLALSLGPGDGLVQRTGPTTRPATRSCGGGQVPGSTSSTTATHASSSVGNGCEQAPTTGRSRPGSVDGRSELMVDHDPPPPPSPGADPGRLRTRGEGMQLRCPKEVRACWRPDSRQGSGQRRRQQPQGGEGTLPMGDDISVDDAVRAFDAARPRLFGIAYRMLGSVGDAEDIVQDAWLRWQQTDRNVVRDPTAFLATTTTRLAVTAATSARARHESYVGPWLPEPVHISADPAARAVQGEELGLALVLLLQRLTPTERAVYVLREAFDYPFRQIAEVLGLTEANARQLGRRARMHLIEERHEPVAPADHSRLLHTFLAAARSGNLAQLEKLLAEDVVSYADGGGIIRAARAPIIGRTSVARYIAGVVTKFGRDVSLGFVESNGEEAVLASRAGSGVALCTIDASATGIERVLIILNPTKLARLATSWLPTPAR